MPIEFKNLGLGTLKNIAELVNSLETDDEPASKGVKAALRRMRVNLSSLMKQSKLARASLLDLMKGDSKKDPD